MFLGKTRGDRKSRIIAVSGRLVVVFMLFSVFVCLSATAEAVDAPKWVAAIYVKAQSAIGMRWTPVPGATEYKVFKSATSGKEYKEIASTAAPQYFDSDVEPGSTYYYVLQALAGAEASGNSLEKVVAIPGEKIKILLPPEWTQADYRTTTEFGKVSHRVGLSWKPSKGGTVVAYNVYKSTEPGKGYQMLSSTTEIKLSDDKVEEGKTYYYVLTALDDQFAETKYSEERKIEIKKVEVVEKKKEKVKKELVVQPTRFLYHLGPEDPGVPRMNNPSDVAVSEDGSLVYVCDSVNNIIRVYDGSGSFVMAFPDQQGEGAEQSRLLQPNAILWYDYNLYVTNPQLGQIKVFDEQGRWQKSLVVKDSAESKKANPPYITAIDFRPDGTPVAVDPRNARIVFLDDDFNVTGEILNTADGEKFGGSNYLDMDSEGNVYAVATINYSVYAFDSEGGNIAAWGSAGQVAGKFMRPVGISIDKDDNIYVSDIVMATVQVFDKKGTFIYALGGEKEGDPLGVSTPNGIHVTDDGLIYIVEGMSGKVSVRKIEGEKYEIQIKKATK